MFQQGCRHSSIAQRQGSRGASDSTSICRRQWQSHELSARRTYTQRSTFHTITTAHRTPVRCCLAPATILPASRLARPAASPQPAGPPPTVKKRAGQWCQGPKQRGLLEAAAHCHCRRWAGPPNAGPPSSARRSEERGIWWPRQQQQRGWCCDALWSFVCIDTITNPSPLIPHPQLPSLEAPHLEDALWQAVTGQLCGGLAQQALPLGLHNGCLACRLFRLPCLFRLVSLL